MPRAPAKPCCWPGCPELTTNRYCPKHQRQSDRDFEKYQREPGRRQRYGKEWNVIRKRVLAEQPLCEMCLSQGRATPATEVHHIIPLVNGGTHDRNNLMALCKRCHSGITIREVRRGPDRYKKLCRSDGRGLKILIK